MQFAHSSPAIALLDIPEQLGALLLESMPSTWKFPSTWTALPQISACFSPQGLHSEVTCSGKPSSSLLQLTPPDTWNSLSYFVFFFSTYHCPTCYAWYFHIVGPALEHVHPEGRDLFDLFTHVLPISVSN